MALLKPATMNETAYLKAGIHGFAGAGKTRTATEIAIGLAKHLGNGKPVAFFDTETGSDFLLPLFKEAGVPLLRVKTRSFKDLLTFMKEAEGQCSVAIIDSITHVWIELQEAYKRRKRIESLQFQDWGPLKAEWREFTDLYVNAQLHAIICGRAGHEYDYETDERGKKELIKTGTKMKAEGEMGYEPSLSLEMVRADAPAAPASRGKKKKDEPRLWVNRCFVLKDRTDKMNGAVIDFPTFASFKPVIDALNIGAVHVGVDTTSTSDDLFGRPDWSRHDRQKQLEITQELIKEAFVLAELDGTSREVTKKRTEHLISAFGTSSWTAITSMQLDMMRACLHKLRVALGQAEQVEPEPEDDGGWLVEKPGPAKVSPEPTEISLEGGRSHEAAE